ncbi:hypothetical protein BGX29_002342, partial [Mortierella sp. GBA35]
SQCRDGSGGKFAVPGGGKPGSDVEDTDFDGDDLVSFFEKRQWCDEVSVLHYLNRSHPVLHVGLLNEAALLLLDEDDLTIVRDVILNNQQLKSVTLDNMSDYDPIYVYQTLAPGRGAFTWRSPNDPVKMRVDIMCNRGRGVQEMLQQYGPLIERLEVNGFTPDQAVALKMSMRSGKGLIALKYISLKGIHLMEPSVREILQAVILQEDIESVVVHGAVTPRRARLDTGELEDDLALSVKLEANVKAWAEFLVAIRFKVTELSLRDDSQMQLLQALRLNEVKALQMSRLRSFSLRSVKFEVHQRDPMFKETLLQLTDVVLGAGPALQQFVVRDEKGIDEKTVAALEEKFRPKSVSAGADINLNGFTV